MQLDHSIEMLRESITGSSPSERREFSLCVDELHDLLDRTDQTGTPAWTAFITKDGVHEAHSLPVPAETLAAWMNG
ncbi:MAG: hypothetical protein ACREPM_03905, partial [Gemmatimonadaceae bacterium]